jgi:Diacylglycerol kinase catalytic domain
MARKQRKVTLIHNETVGAASHGRSEIVKLIERMGDRVRAVSSKADDLDGVLDKPADLVVVAGGDGNNTKVGHKMRTDGPPLGILPLGTANNIAAALSLSGSLDALISSWEAGNLRPFYRFGVEGPWGRFVPRKGSGSDQQKRTVLLNSLDSLATVIIHSGALLNPFIRLIRLPVDCLAGFPPPRHRARSRKPRFS